MIRGAGRPRCGVALLDALLAVTVLAVALVTFAVVARDSAHASSTAAAREAEAQEASRFLHSVALWTRRDLDQRLGTRRQGLWRLEVRRDTELLYSVTLWDSTATRRVLSTTIYRAR